MEIALIGPIYEFVFYGFLAIFVAAGFCAGAVVFGAWFRPIMQGFTGMGGLQ